MKPCPSCNPVPTYPHAPRFPFCKPPRKAVLTVNGKSPDGDGNVDLTKDFEDIVPQEGMTLNEVGAKVNEVVGRLNPRAGGPTPRADHGPYGLDTQVGDIHPDATLEEIAAVIPPPSVDGKLPMRPLPKYLHELSFDDAYPEDAMWLYGQLGSGDVGRCSAVRRGGRLYRNYDWTFDGSAEFVVRMSGNASRFASVGIASVGTRLTEDAVMSAISSRYYRCLPGMTLDGINENGVVCEINVDSGPADGWNGSGADAIHILAVVRWVLDHGRTARQAAEWVAGHVTRPSGGMNFHFMVADPTETYIVENGTYAPVVEGDVPVLTNFPVVEPGEGGPGMYSPEAMWESYHGPGIERLRLLAGGAPITDARFTNAYRPGNDWDSDFDSHGQHLAAIGQWAAQGEDREAHRGKTSEGGKAWWQTVHTTEYDFAARAMRVAVQETDVWYVFSAGVAGAVRTVNGIGPENGNVVVTDGDVPSETYGTVKAGLLGLALSIAGLSGRFDAHKDNDDVHVSVADRKNWNDRYTKQEVDDKITRFSAHFITDKVNGRFVPFSTHARLADAKANHTTENPRFFYAGEGFTPTKNDYCVVLDDESADHKTTRYSYVGDWPSGSFQYQYTINDTKFSQEQWDAINSLISVDEHGNLCFAGIPIVSPDGEVLLPGGTKVSESLEGKRDRTDLKVYEAAPLKTYRWECTLDGERDTVMEEYLNNNGNPREPVWYSYDWGGGMWVMPGYPSSAYADSSESSWDPDDVNPAIGYTFFSLERDEYLYGIAIAMRRSDGTVETGDNLVRTSDLDGHIVPVSNIPGLAARIEACRGKGDLNVYKPETEGYNCGWFVAERGPELLPDDDINVAAWYNYEYLPSGEEVRYCIIELSINGSVVYQSGGLYDTDGEFTRVISLDDFMYQPHGGTDYVYIEHTTVTLGRRAVPTGGSLLTADDVAPVLTGGVKIAQVGGKSLYAPSGAYPMKLLSAQEVDGELHFYAEDLAINKVVLSTNVTAHLHLPGFTTSNCRDFIVKIEVTSEMIPTFVVHPPAGENVGFEATDENWSVLEAGTNFFTFTETER